MFKKLGILCASLLFFGILIKGIMPLISKPLKPFSTLTALQEYASKYNEFPKSDDDFWSDPDFTSYHKSLNPNLFSRMLRSVGLSQNNLWNIKVFEKTLNKVLGQRKKADLSGRKIAHIQLSYPARVIVWGDIEGSFHSLVRMLSWLNQQGILNDNLEVVKTDYYLVFNGNAITRTAYVLETLTTLMLLIERNPERVIYVRGFDEDHKNWHDDELKRELLIRTNRRLTGVIPFEEPVSAFFDTLPLAFYISTIKEPESLIRISPTGLDDAEINESQCGSFWEKAPKDSIHYYDITQKEPVPKPVAVKVIIKTEDWMIESRSVTGEPRNMFGLGLLDQDQGATAWSILSSPNMGNQKYIGFDYDAFGMLTIESTIEQSSIRLYNQKISLLQGFKEHEAFNILTGIQLARENVFKKEFKIGSTLGLLGGLPVMSKRIMRGMSACIQKANLSDELPSIRLTLTTYNDDYTPYIAHANILKLIEKDHVDVVLCPTGHQTLASYLDLIKENKILTLFPIAGSPEFFKPDLVGLINYRATADDEIRALIDNIIHEKSVKKFAFFYQDDAYGTSALKSAHDMLEKHGITEWTDIPYLRGSTDFKKQADLLKEKNPDAIGFFSTALSTREFMRQVGTANLTNKVLFGPSFLGEMSIRAYIQRQGLNIIFGAVVPNPTLDQSALAQEYRKQMDVNKYQYGTFSFEAYIGASILIDALEHVKTPTPEKIKKYLESLKDYDLKGITLSFNPERRQLSTKVWIETGPNTPWIEKSLNNIEDQEEHQHGHTEAPIAPTPETPPAEAKKAIDMKRSTD
jgi:ABC-type branched-subunit amino acid transport system substrate-binding protein